MKDESLEPREVRRALASIQMGHQLGGHELTEEDLDRARRILTGELAPDMARMELDAALQALVDDERAN